MRRFFVPGTIAPTMEITGQDARHIAKVLRLAPGDEILVADKDGRTARAAITAVRAAGVSLAVTETLTVNCEPPVAVWLAQGLPKGDKLEYVIQKAVEVGAAGIVPLAADNCTVRYEEGRLRGKQERWRKIAYEAAKQCGRGSVPDVTPVRTLAELLDAPGRAAETIMLFEGPGGRPLKDILAESGHGPHLLLVGPEGGFSAAEAALCRDRGVRIATLGPRILRTETAAVAALSIVMYEKGDLGSGRC